MLHENRDTEQGITWRQKQRLCDASVSQRTLWTVSNYQKLGRSKEGYFPGKSEGCIAMLSPGFWTRTSRTMGAFIFVVFKPTDLGSIVMAALGKVCNDFSCPFCGTFHRQNYEKISHKLPFHPHMKSGRVFFRTPFCRWRNDTSREVSQCAPGSQITEFLSQAVKTVFALSKLFNLELGVVLGPGLAHLSKRNSHRISSCSNREHSFGVWGTNMKGFGIPAMWLLSKFLNLSGLQFPYLQNSEKGIYLTVLLSWLMR